MAVEPGHLVDKQSFVDRFNGHVRNWLQAQIVWHDGNIPADFPSGVLGSAHLPPATATDADNFYSDDNDTIATARTMVELFRSFSLQYSRVRKVRFRKRGNVSNNILYDETQVSALNPSYATIPAPSPGDSIIVDGGITAHNWNVWMEQLRSNLEANMNLTLEDEAFITVIAEPPPPPADGGRGRR
jgi:hypothetical protein